MKRKMSILVSLLVMFPLCFQHVRFRGILVELVVFHKHFHPNRMKHHVAAAAVDIEPKFPW